MFPVVGWPVWRKAGLCVAPVPPCVLGEQFGGLSSILHVEWRVVGTWQHNPALPIEHVNTSPPALFSWDAATLLMHFCASRGLAVSHRLQAQSWRCLRGCSPALLSGMLWERHPATARRGQPDPHITAACTSRSWDKGHQSQGTRWPAVPGLVLAWAFCTPEH